MKKIIILIAVLTLAGGGVYWLKGRLAHPVAPQPSADILYYTCVMHPFLHRDEPGKCPICSMDLVPVKKEKAQAQATPAERKVKYWMDAMNPSHHYDHAGQAPDGMDLVPVYEEDGSPVAEGNLPEVLKGLAPVKLTPFKEQMIGVRLAKVEGAQVVRDIRTVGRFAGGAGDFAAASADFTGQGILAPRGGTYVVADVYALDQPFVKAGQRAWVSPFSHPELKMEGRVARFYPYDGTQSRVMRVKIDLKAPLSQEVFANVQIEAAIPAHMAVPRDAVLHTGTQAYVFVERSPGEFAATPVMVGFQGDELCEIAAGLKAGDEVAWGGNFMLDADAHINASSVEAK